MTVVTTGLWIAVLVTGAPAVIACSYLLLLTCLSRKSLALRCTARPNLDVIIPAHNEASGISRTLESVLSVRWPKDSFRIIVIADNCTDGTAQVAATHGVTVLERRDNTQRGKGYALKYAFDFSRKDAWANAVVVVDADSLVSANFLEGIAARLEIGAAAVQVDYSVQNPHDSWRTRLMAIALGAFHRVRSRARERMQLSCGIRGNGWCVTHRLLDALPYGAFSLTEDIEYGVDLGLLGVRVHYCDEAQVFGEMVSDAKNAEQQRQRWEQGRLELIRRRVPQLLATAFRNKDRVCLDLAMDLMVLPLSYVAMNVAAFVAVTLLASFWLSGVEPAVLAACLCVVAVGAYVLRGWQVSGVGWRGILDLAYAPVFVVWKIIMAITRRRTTEWVRTERERR